jgi:hypothetical protein
MNLEAFFDQASPMVEERARQIRAVEEYMEYISDVDAMPHCDPRVLHSPGACVYCDEVPHLQQFREMTGLRFTDKLHAKDALLPGQDRSRASAEAWGGNQPGKDRE